MAYRLDPPDRPWVMRTYAGHSSAAASNALYRRNLAKGQTGLSVAFDLPTQTGYDADHELARGEVGRVGVPIGHLGDMRALFEGIPLGSANTSMTINATAMWLLALYQVVAEEHGADPSVLAGTTQNDIVKEYLSRGTYIFPPGPSLRLTADLVAYAVTELPRWNPVNICSYHLQEAGATPVQEVGFALGTAVAVLDAVRDYGQVPPERFGEVVARVSFFVNAGVRFVEEMAKMRAFVALWDEITEQRYGIQDPKQRRLRYGVQVNSLGLPRPWDQQWSLRMQQVLAYESDLLEYPDLFDGSPVVAGLVASIVDGARTELDQILDQGGIVGAVESGYLKSALVASLAQRRHRLETGEDVVVGVNRSTETEPSPLTEAGAVSVERIDPAVEEAAIDALAKWRANRSPSAVEAALARLRADAATDANLMPSTVECVRAGVTTGEWAGALREVFGEYRAPTGLTASSGAGGDESLARVRERVAATAAELGASRLRMLVGKPGLDGHSNGAEQIAVRARDAGFEVVYQGIRLTPAQIVAAAVAEDVNLVGLSVLSGSHMAAVPAVLDGLRAAGLGDVPVVVGGIIPPADEEALRAAGVARVFTPKDFQLTSIVDGLVSVVREAAGLS